MKNATKTIIFTTFIVLATAASFTRAHGDLVGYDFDTGANVGTIAPTFTALNISASNFGVGAGLNVVLATEAGSGNLDAEGDPFGTANDHNFGGERNAFGFTQGTTNPTVNTTLATAISNDDYLTFTVTPQNGESFDLESFTFRSYIGASASRAANSWALFTDVGGFTSGNEVGTGTSTTASGWSDNIVTLGSQFDNVSTTTEFRLYIYGAAGNSRNSATIFDKVIVNGDPITVPEPSSLALLAGGLGLLAATRRRRRVHSV